MVILSIFQVTLFYLIFATHLLSAIQTSFVQISFKFILSQLILKALGGTFKIDLQIILILLFL
jgi:hypothetical protein